MNNCYHQTGGTEHGIALMPVLENIGLRLYGPRLYDVDLGRFLMPDTIIPNLYEPQSMNPYSYCHNDPVNYIDPSGHYRRVPRIFPYGDMPSASTNALMGVMQLLGVILGAVAGWASNNVRLGTGVALSVDLLFNAFYPTLLSPDRRTMPRRNLVQRLLVDILFHGVAAFAGFKFSRLSGTRLLPLLIANSGMLVGGMWSSQLGGLMKSFGMGYNLGRLQPAPGRTEEMYCAGRAGDLFSHQFNRDEYEEIPDGHAAVQPVSTDTGTAPVHGHHGQVGGTDREAYEQLPDDNAGTGHMPGGSATGAGYPDPPGPQATFASQDGGDDIWTLPSLTPDQSLHHQQPSPSPEVVCMPSPYRTDSVQPQWSFGSSPPARPARLAIVLPPEPSTVPHGATVPLPPRQTSAREELYRRIVEQLERTTKKERV